MERLFSNRKIGISSLKVVDFEIDSGGVWFED